MIVKRAVDESFEDEIHKLKERFDELKGELSEIRKKGKDTKLAEVYLFNVHPKLKMALATYSPVDLEKAKTWIDYFQEEIENAKKGEDYVHDIDLIHKAYEHIYRKEKHDAILVYDQLRTHYSKYPEEQRRLIYMACLDIHQMISDKL